MATTHRKRQVELYKSIFLFTFFIYNIYFLWEKTSAWGHSNPATYVLKTEGDYRYGFGCKPPPVFPSVCSQPLNQTPTRYGSASETDGHFSNFATQQDFNKKKGWSMLRSSTRHHIFNLVVIEPEVSEKFKVSD